MICQDIIQLAIKHSLLNSCQHLAQFLKPSNRNRVLVRACEIAALRIGDVFDAQGKARDTIYLAAAQTKGSDTATVLANKKLRAQLQRYAAA